RRFETHNHNVKGGHETRYIDDYAHHPAEIKATLDSVRFLYPDLKICAVFQPHLYTRTRDLAADFAEALSIVDDVVLLDIYPAREKPIPGVTSSIILDKVTSKKKVAVTKAELIGELEKHDFDILLTLGAGDIDLEIPKIVEFMHKRND
ncbi:MAG: UDP-N-acetylmuramate--L-alanine ligase, partial [Paludibacteraceae bacterium]|nr:UDP-N-acetylmuramate--L-alanine ligase [Paludibacteraceae bacterium]